MAVGKHIPFWILPLLFAAWAAPAWGVSVYDLSADPVLPEVVDTANAPVYFTNASPDSAASGQVDTFRVGARSRFHMGYDYAAPAVGDVALTVAGDMAVDGTAFLGKTVTSGEHDRPEAAGQNAVSLTVGHDLRVNSGGGLSLVGASAEKHGVATAERILVDGGSVSVGRHAELRTASTDPDAEPLAGYSVQIRNGGALILDSGLPPLDSGEGPETWAFAGVDVADHGAGVLVGAGGVLGAGESGGVVSGSAGQGIVVERGGALDAGRGNVLATGVDAVSVAGSYRAGYDRATGGTTRLIVQDGSVSFAHGASLGLSRDLQRHANTAGVAALGDTILVQAAGGVTLAGDLSTLHTGMGSYALVPGMNAESGYEYVRIGGVENAVQGTCGETDRELFRANVGRVWSPIEMNRDQADNIYNLTAVETPSIVAWGEAGQRNQAILEAFVDGRNQAAGGYGVVDRGLFEMYSGAAQWGVNTAALNTAEEVMGGLDRRVQRIGAEMDRLGEGWSGYASCPPAADIFERRFWIGGFGRDEEAKDDDGIAGYTYRPRGLMLGYDKPFGPVSVGMAAAYGKGDYRDKAAESSDSKITSYSAGVYGTYHTQGGIGLTGHAVFSHFDNDLSDLRGGMRRTADHSAYAWSIGAKAGYDRLLTDRLTLSPSLGLTRAQAVSRAHDESLDGVGTMRIGDMRRDSLLVPLDLTLGYDVVRTSQSILRVTGNVGYAYDFENGGLDGRFVYEGLAGATSMRVTGREPGRHRVSLGAGVLLTGNRFDFGARYDYSKRADQSAHQARGSLGVTF